MSLTTADLVYFAAEALNRLLLLFVLRSEVISIILTMDGRESVTISAYCHWLLCAVCKTCVKNIKSR